MRIDLTGNVAFITGAAAGIGKACARIFLENSAAVVIADVNHEKGSKTAQELSQFGRCEFVHLDVTQRDRVEDIVSGVAERYGRIDISVHNAGIVKIKDRVNIDEYSFEDWKRILSVDLDGVFNCAHSISRIMVKQKSGRIINMGSVFGSVPGRKQIAYVSAKAAVHNLTRSMALELAPYGINVNAVAPGSILTDVTKKLFYGEDAGQAEMVKRMLSHVPLGRPGVPEDVANAVLFLSGPESRYITGHVLVVDGGWTCGYTRDF